MYEQVELLACGAISFLIILSMFTASAAITHELETVVENKNDETYSASIQYETELMEQETCLNFYFLTSMLQMLDLNFNLNFINETLSAHVKEYPFLQPTIELGENLIHLGNSIFQSENGKITRF